MVYHFKVHKEKNGFWAECIELEGCQTQGETLKELQSNAEEALNLFLSESDGYGVVFPLPKKMPSKKGLMLVETSPEAALATLLRHLRNKKGLTLEAVTKMMGFKSITAYRKLESPKTCNPELKTLKKLKRVYSELDVDDVLD